MIIEIFKVQENQWIIKRKNKTYPIKNLESLFVYGLAFGINFNDLEEIVLWMNKTDFNIAIVEKGKILYKRN